MAPIADPRYLITFTASNGLNVQVMAGADSATLTDGFGGWEEVERPKRTSMTRWKGKPLFRQDVPVLFDGYSLNKNVEVDCATLLRMSQQAAVNAPPPTIKVTGPLERPDLMWVIENITWDSQEVIRDIIGGSSVRMRQGAVVHLLQYIDDKVLVTPPKPKVATKVKDGAGKTAKQLSQETYGTPDFWAMFKDAAGKPIAQPRKKIPKGTKVTLPPVRIF